MGKNRETPFIALSFKNRLSQKALTQKVNFEAMYESFKKNVIRTKETVEEYKKGDDTFRTKCKDHGGFIMGESLENRRDIYSITKRNMITLDLDYCPQNIMGILYEKDIKFNTYFRYLVYSTHSSTREKPRLRIIIPLLRDVTPEEYEPIALRICGIIGLQYFDATTCQVNRIMFYPTVSIDGDYICEIIGKNKYDLDPDVILKEYFDINNIDEWQRPHWIEGKKKEKIDKGELPDSTKTKYRIINSFNTEYSITEAIDTFIPDVYIKEKNDRYTYVNSSTKNGLNILNHQYAFSFHGTDPAQGRLLDAFNIVRIHKFGKKDLELGLYDEVKEKDSVSFVEMTNWIERNLPNVMKHDPKIIEQKEKAKELTMIVTEDKNVVESDTSWMDNMERNRKTGEIVKCPYNIGLIISNDTHFKNLFFYDTIKQQICFNSQPFWDKDVKKGEGIRDLDLSFVRDYISQPPYFLSGKDAIEDRLMVEAYKRKINFPKKFLSELPEWDDEPRCETIFTKLFGVNDCEFVREASKKWFTALVARIMNPGAKFDYVISLIGSVGIGKSSFGRSLIAPDWDGYMENVENSNYFFSDKEIDLRNERDTVDAIRGICVLELAEFDKFLTKYDKATLKSFITKTRDRFIERYGKRTIDVPRSFVMIATTNELKPIKNPDDERRFLPFYCTLPKNKALCFDHKLWNKEIRDQVLAEALHYYQTGYSYSAPFNPKQQRQWEILIEKASLDNDNYGIVKDYIDTKFPTNYLNWSVDSMKMNWRNIQTNEVCKSRMYFSIKEIYVVALDKRMGDSIDYITRQEITQSLKKLGFKKSEQRKTFGPFGTQTFFERIVKNWALESTDVIQEKVKDLNELFLYDEISYEDRDLLDYLVKELEKRK